MRKIDLILLSITAYLTFSGPAFAYLDPGTGSIILQGIIGAIAGASIFARGYIHSVKAFFARSGPKKDDSADQDDDRE